MLPDHFCKCTHCGLNFPAFGKELICPKCRRQSTLTERRLNRPILTARERGIVALVQQAKQNKEIAWLLRKTNGQPLTEGTVKVYLSAIFRKMGVMNRTELAVYADKIIAAKIAQQKAAMESSLELSAAA